jgi:hypothetical protein
VQCVDEARHPALDPFHSRVLCLGWHCGSPDLRHGTGERARTGERVAEPGRGDLDVDVIGMNTEATEAERRDEAVENALTHAASHKPAEAALLPDRQWRP